MIHILAKNWWALAIRGVLAILFGILTFVVPGITLTALILLFGAYASVEGLFNVVAAIRHARAHDQWGLLLFEGIVSVAIGVLTFVWPAITALTLVYFIASWALITGVLEIAAAIRLRKEIKGEWLLALAGVASIGISVLLFIAPTAGALALVMYIGAYAVVFGALLIGLSFRLRSWARRGDIPVMRPVHGT